MREALARALVGEGEDGLLGVVQDDLDGMTLTLDSADGRPQWWLNLRASNTEPLLRLNVEAADEATLHEVRDKALAIIRA